MKKLVTVSLSIMAIGIIAFNLNTKSNLKNNGDLTLSNLESLQASAAEMYCDQKNQTKCIISAGGYVGVSKGYLKFSD